MSNSLLIQYPDSQTHETLQSHLKATSLSPIFSLHTQIKSSLDILTSFTKHATNASYRHIRQYVDLNRFYKLFLRWYQHSLCRLVHVRLRDKVEEEQLWKKTGRFASESDAVLFFYNEDVPHFFMDELYNIEFSGMNGVKFGATNGDAKKSAAMKPIATLVADQLLALLQETRLLCHMICLIEEFQIHVYGTTYLKEGSNQRRKSLFLLFGVYAKLYACFKSYLLVLRNVYKHLRQVLELLPRADLEPSVSVRKFSEEIRYKPTMTLPLSLEQYCGRILDIVQTNNKNHKYKDLPRVEDFLVEFQHSPSPLPEDHDDDYEAPDVEENELDAEFIGL